MREGRSVAEGDGSHHWVANDVKGTSAWRFGPNVGPDSPALLPMALSDHLHKIQSAASQQE